MKTFQTSLFTVKPSYRQRKRESPIQSIGMKYDKQPHVTQRAEVKDAGVKRARFMDAREECSQTNRVLESIIEPLDAKSVTSLAKHILKLKGGFIVPSTS